MFSIYTFIVLAVQQLPEPARNPCLPSPCGFNAVCNDINGIPSCTCLPEYQGLPPNCHPQCAINQDCPSDKACINQKCRDPCPGSCGQNAVCNVFSHVPACTCRQGFTGDPFSSCVLVPLIEGKKTLKKLMKIYFYNDYPHNRKLTSYYLYLFR